MAAMAQHLWGNAVDSPHIFQVPPSATKQQVDELLNVADRLQARTALTLPNGYTLSLLEAIRALERFRIGFELAGQGHSLALLTRQSSASVLERTDRLRTPSAVLIGC